jgi:hypothetical protein
MSRTTKLLKSTLQLIKRPINKKKERDDAVRFHFINEMIRTRGKYLLDYVQIVEFDSKVPCKKVIDSIVSKTGLGFNKMQISVIHYYLREMGAQRRKQTARDYYRNVIIKDNVC